MNEYVKESFDRASYALTVLRSGFPVSENPLVARLLRDVGSGLRDIADALVSAEAATKEIIEGAPVVEAPVEPELQELPDGTRLSTDTNAEALRAEYKKLIAGYETSDGTCGYYARPTLPSRPREHAESGCKVCISSQVYELLKRYLPLLDLTTAELLAHFTNSTMDDAQAEIDTILAQMWAEKKA